MVGPFKGKLRVAQHDWMTANPGKVITIHDLVSSLTNAVYQASVTARNIRAVFPKFDTWPFSALAFSEENFELSSVTPVEKNTS